MRGLKLSQWLIVALLALVVVGVWVTALRLIPFMRQSAAPPIETPTTVPLETPTLTVAPSQTPELTPTPTTAASETPAPIPSATYTPAPTSTLVPSPTNTPVPTSTATRIPASPTPTSTVVPATATPTVKITDWRGEYFGGRSLEGAPRVVRNDKTVDFNLPLGTAPASNIPGENWSARWRRDWRFDEGNYRFRVLVDDGARLWVGGQLLIDAWADGSARTITGDLYLKGEVPIKLEYYNHLGDARVRLSWDRVTQFDGWKGSYYDVRDLSGLPVFQRDDRHIDFNWGAGSPRSDIPADNFSVRWEQRLRFDRAGLYRFRAEADDGVRVWVDGEVVIRVWHDGYSTAQEVVRLTEGAHDLRVDYYEHLGGAAIRVSWEFVPRT